MTAPGPVWISGKVIEKNAAGIAVEFPVTEHSGYKVVIPAGTAAAMGQEVGDTAEVEGELLSIVDTRNPDNPGLGSVCAHVKVAGVDFYVDPDQAKVREFVSEDPPTAEIPAVETPPETPTA